MTKRFDRTNKDFRTEVYNFLKQYAKKGDNVKIDIDIKKDKYDYRSRTIKGEVK